VRFFLVLFSVLSAIHLSAQTLDFGLDLKANANFLQSYNNKSSFVQQVQVYSSSPDNIVQPSFNFGFLNDEADTIFVHFNETRLLNNIEFPIYGKFVSKNGWSVGLSYSLAKYKLEFDGPMSRSKYHFRTTLGTFDEFVQNYGGQFDSTTVDGDDKFTYNDSTAYESYFNTAVRNDPYSQSQALYREEFRLSSLYFHFGYEFLRHKLIRPYFQVGVGLISTTKSYSRQYFDIPNPDPQLVTKRDLSLLSDEIPTYTTFGFGTKLDIGIELYRYHFGVSGNFVFNLNNNFYEDSPNLLNTQPPGIGNGAISLYLGADLYSIDFKSNDFRKDIYKDEYSSLSSSLKGNRLFEFAMKVKAPLVSRMKNYDHFSLINYTDILDPENPTYINKRWESLSFRDISRVDWTPEVMASGRFGIKNRWKAEVFVGFSMLELDTKVQELKTNILWDTTAVESYFDSSDYKISMAVFRSVGFPLKFGLNGHYELYDNGIVRLNAFGGAAFNYYFVRWRMQRDPGINGVNEDIYHSTNDYYVWGSGLDVLSGTWYSPYSENINSKDSPDQMLEKYNSAGMTRLSDWDQRKDRRKYFLTAQAGFELEINRILFGASADVSITEVDGIFAKNFVNFNLSLGYIFATKSRSQ